MSTDAFFLTHNRYIDRQIEIHIDIDVDRDINTVSPTVYSFPLVFSIVSCIWRVIGKYLRIGIATVPETYLIPTEKHHEGQFGCHRLRNLGGGFPGGAVVESLPANAGDTGSSPGLGRSHVPRSNWAREPQLLSLRVWSLCSATREAAMVRGPRTAMKSGPRLLQLEKALEQKRRPNTAIN